MQPKHIKKPFNIFVNIYIKRYNLKGFAACCNIFMGMQFLKNYFVPLKNRLVPVVLLFFHPPFLAAQTSGPTPIAGKPFPQHVLYSPGILMPDHVSRRQLDDSARSFYTAWKDRYIRKGCSEGQYYVWFEEPGRKQCV